MSNDAQTGDKFRTQQAAADEIAKRLNLPSDAQAARNALGATDMREMPADPNPAAVSVSAIAVGTTTVPSSLGHLRLGTAGATSPFLNICVDPDPATGLLHVNTRDDRGREVFGTITLPALVAAIAPCLYRPEPVRVTLAAQSLTETSNEMGNDAQLDRNARDNQMHAEANRTFCILKPDALRRGLVGAIITDLEAWFNIRCMELVAPTQRQVREHYWAHRGKPYFDDLCTFMLSGRVVAMVLISRFLDIEAPGKLRDIMGPFREPRDPTSIRGRHMKPGVKAYENLIHGSDSYSEAAREASLWLDLRTHGFYDC